MAKSPARIVLWYFPKGLAILGFLLWPQRWLLWGVAFLWAGLACCVNAKKCGRVHCTFTGPLYGLLGLMALGRSAGWWLASPVWLWCLAVGGTLVSFVPEWRGKRYWSVTSSSREE